MVLVHHQRNVRPLLRRCLDQVLDEGLARVFAGSCTGLQDDRRAHFICRRHDRLDLFEIVDIESRNAVAVFSGVVEQFAHRDECHGVVIPES